MATKYNSDITKGKIHVDLNRCSIVKQPVDCRPN